MKIKRPAVAGTLESSDRQVAVEEGRDNRVVVAQRRDQSVWRSDKEGRL